MTDLSSYRSLAVLVTNSLYSDAIRREIKPPLRSSTLALRLIQILPVLNYDMHERVPSSVIQSECRSLEKQ